MKPEIIILDDEPNIVEVLLTRLEAKGYNVSGFVKPSQALEAVKRKNAGVILTDLKMPEKDGLSILTEAKELNPDIEVIIFTAYGTISGAVEAMRQGAYDYILKPFNPVELIAKIDRALEKRQLKQRVRALEKEVESSTSEKLIYAVSRSMNHVLNICRQVSSTDATILITGESGTGKELVARMIHKESNRRDNNFIIMDCGATPAGLIESEMFGYVKGAFTGAIRDKTGIVEEADQGTLFLDEIGNISPELQTRLLRVIEYGEFRRVGDVSQKHADIRVIAATNADLQLMVREGTFREDLYYRLKVINVDIPPLRERTEDIPGLIQIFINEFSKKTGKNISGISKEALDIMKKYSWPGNVRELKNTIQSAVVLSGTDMITRDDLMISGICEPEEIFFDSMNKLEETEKDMVVDALKKARWVQNEAAKSLGISRRVMHYKIKKYNINMGEKTV
jgi:DNA-binding NtrC family response regulator